MTITAVRPAMLIVICLLSVLNASVALAAARTSIGDGGASRRGQVWVATASFYGQGLPGKTTAGGEKFDKNALNAAHPSYPMGTLLKVTNLGNGRAVNVRVNDRGPVKKH